MDAHTQRGPRRGSSVRLEPLSCRPHATAVSRTRSPEGLQTPSTDRPHADVCCGILSPRLPSPLLLPTRLSIPPVPLLPSLYASLPPPIPRPSSPLLVPSPPSSSSLLLAPPPSPPSHSSRPSPRVPTPPRPLLHSQKTFERSRRGAVAASPHVPPCASWWMRWRHSAHSTKLRPLWGALCCFRFCLWLSAPSASRRFSRTNATPHTGSADMTPALKSWAILSRASLSAFRGYEVRPWRLGATTRGKCACGEAPAGVRRLPMRSLGARSDAPSTGREEDAHTKQLPLLRAAATAPLVRPSRGLIAFRARSRGYRAGREGHEERRSRQWYVWTRGAARGVAGVPDGAMTGVRPSLIGSVPPLGPRRAFGRYHAGNASEER